MTFTLSSAHIARSTVGTLSVAVARFASVTITRIPFYIPYPSRLLILKYPSSHRSHICPVTCSRHRHCPVVESQPPSFLLPSASQWQSGQVINNSKQTNIHLHPSNENP